MDYANDLYTSFTYDKINKDDPEDISDVTENFVSDDVYFEQIEDDNDQVQSRIILE